MDKLRKFELNENVFVLLGIGAWMNGKVLSVNEDGTYDVELLDGAIERGVNRDKAQSQRGEFKVGDKIEANWKALGTYYTGRISIVHAAPEGQVGDTYYINYDDGDTEDNVPALRIRHIFVGEVVPIHPPGTLKLGDRVLANWKSRGTWYSGRISAARQSGAEPSNSDLFDVSFDDGDFEACISLDRIKLATATESEYVASDLIPIEKAAFMAGDSVEINLDNNGDWQRGHIENACDGNCYDVRLESGRLEAAIPVGQIRSPLEPLKIGEKISANWLGRGTYYSGTVTKLIDDDKYNIVYDDGDVEPSVPRIRIRGANDIPVVFNRDQRVFANFGGKGTFQPGKIVKVSCNNAYNVLYDNGDIEAGVPSYMIRAIETAEVINAAAATTPVIPTVTPNATSGVVTSLSSQSPSSKASVSSEELKQANPVGADLSYMLSKNWWVCCFCHCQCFKSPTRCICLLPDPHQMNAVSQTQTVYDYYMLNNNNNNHQQQLQTKDQPPIAEAELDTYWLLKQ